MNKFVVLGGAGSRGRKIVSDLLRFARPTDQILIADLDLEAAHEVAYESLDPRLYPLQIDIRNLHEAERVLNDACVIVNCTRNELNTEVMEAALRVGAHYIDLSLSEDSMNWNERFRKSKRVAVLGPGPDTEMTSSFISIAALMLAEKEIEGSGTLSSMLALPPASFAKQLKKRKSQSPFLDSAHSV